jgi:hypothetical protein
MLICQFKNQSANNGQDEGDGSGVLSGDDCTSDDESSETDQSDEEQPEENSGGDKWNDALFPGCLLKLAKQYEGREDEIPQNKQNELARRLEQWELNRKAQEKVNEVRAVV